MTEFSKVLMDLAGERGIPTRAALAQRIVGASAHVGREEARAVVAGRAWAGFVHVSAAKRALGLEKPGIARLLEAIGLDAKHSIDAGRGNMPERRKMTELQEHIEYMRDFGLSEEEIEAKIQDRDLWVIEPMYSKLDVLQGEEGVRQWREASAFLGMLAVAVLQEGLSEYSSHAMFHVIWDASDRAEEALRRAEERLKES